MQCARPAWVGSAICALGASALAESTLLSGANQDVGETPMATQVEGGANGTVTGLEAPSFTMAQEGLGTDSPEPSGSAAYSGWVPSYLRGQSQFSAELFAGVRYDTDANQAANTLVPGQTTPSITSSTFQKQADWSFVNKVGINHQFMPWGWHGVVWETNADVSDQRFFHISANYDLTIAEADTGPRFSIGQVGQGRISVRPFASFVWTGYAEDTFSSLYGGGLSAEVRSPRWSASLVGIGRFGNYEDSSFRPMTWPYTGPEWLLSVSTTLVINSATSLATSFWCTE